MKTAAQASAPGQRGATGKAIPDGNGWEAVTGAVESGNGVGRQQIDPHLKIEQLERALSTQPVIEQAKGMVMLLRSWTSEEAFTALRMVSQRTNVKLHDVATVIVASGSRVESSLKDGRVVRTVLAEVRRTVLGTAFAEEPDWLSGKLVE